MPNHRLKTQLIVFALSLLIFSSCVQSPKKRDSAAPDAKQSKALAGKSASKSAEATCEHCGQALNDYVQFHGSKYHHHCYREVGPKCGVCRAALIGPAIELGHGFLYHKACFEKTPRCQTCSLPAAGDRGRLRQTDGLKICGTCANDAVDNEAEFKALIRETRQDLLQLGIDWRPKIRFELKLAHEVAAFKVGHNPHGLTIIEKPTNSDLVYTIYVVKSLPKSLVRGVLAHEMFHVWQSENKVNLAHKFHEGSANYVQWLVLRRRRAELWEQLVALNPDPIYGEGFRAFRSWVGSRKPASWLKSLPDAKELEANH